MDKTSRHAPYAHTDSIKIWRNQLIHGEFIDSKTACTALLLPTLRPHQPNPFFANDHEAMRRTIDKAITSTKEMNHHEKGEGRIQGAR